ncbi:hypothetical protein [Planomonospora sp. ID82291]|uniref:hypothetical protein n=1 Tax=Planomonospora sp. ID82291 TaxID=2738136 RepID=UPI0018C4175C|nr:hypothetical protein [Planomonospora sp. ID82291]MBG0814486.1 hypothetical protein [Planomonospora sp. ID82291]
MVFVGLAGAASACTVTVAGRRPPPRPDTLPEPPELEAAGEVWPEAVFTLPTRLGKGPYVQPVAMLGGDEVLMVTPFELPRFLAYDRRTKRHRVLATAPRWGGCSLCYEIRSVAVGRTRIAWTVGVYRSEPWNAGKRHVELWSMPRSGGPMRLVMWLTGHDDVPLHDALVIDGGDAVWHDGDDAYRISLTAARPRKTPERSGSGPLTVPHPNDHVSCGAEWCVRALPPRPYELTTLAVERRDGSGRTTVTASSGGALIGDRFGLFGPPYVYDDGPVHITVGRSESSAILYDRCTGGSAWAGARKRPETEDGTGQDHGITRGTWGPDDPILFWRELGGKRHTVLDLARVPDRPCGD